MSLAYVIAMLKRRGFTTLRVGRDTDAYRKYGLEAPLEACPEHQLRAVYWKGKHYVSRSATPKYTTKSTKDKQLTFEF
jgi:hypothetical protein